MADRGMTPEGFIPKRLAEILDEMNSALADIQDPKTGETPFQNITDDSILQQVVGVFAGQLEQAWNAAYEASVQFDPLKNTGAGQSGTVQLNALLRKPGTYTQVTMQLSGQPNTFIPAGSRIGAVDKLHFVTTKEDVTIPNSGVVTVVGVAGAKEEWRPDNNTIVLIQTPISGWNNATNIDILSVGTLEESDEQLRMRQQQSTSNTAYRLIDAIYAAVRNVPGVIFVHAYQNTSDNPIDFRGIPFKEVSVVVDGGDNQAIGEALYYRLPTGQTGYGQTKVDFVDANGIVNPIYFNRPSRVPIFIDIKLTVINPGTFPTNYESQIKQAIINYAKYGGNGNEDGFPPGVNITRSRLYTPINDTPGHRIDSLKIGTSWGSVKESDIAMNWLQVGEFTEENIKITVTYA